MKDVLLDFTAVIISQSIHVSNHHVVDFKYTHFICQLNFSKAGKSKVEIN
jgi:hypothetical protein